MKKPKKNSIRISGNLVLIPLLTFFFLGSLNAEDKKWNTTDGYWSNGDNWDPAGVPKTGDHVKIWKAGSKVTYNDNSNQELGLLQLDYPQNEQIGGQGTPQLLQKSYTVTTQETQIGVSAGDRHVQTRPGESIKPSTTSL